MCAIAGLVGNRPVNQQTVKAMTDLLAHRGPDDEGLWQSQDEKVVLGHRRLSILDISSAGHQPMISGSQVITFNGEIYNYVELAERLSGEGVRFKSRSDTEVLLAAYRQWGEDCVTEFNGMFAFAIFDEAQQTLFCARDRYGEKPFLFCAGNDYFAFASEYKALLCLDGIGSDYEMDRLLRFLYHPTRGLDEDLQTVFSEIYQLPPAHRLTLNMRDLSWQLDRYWDVTPQPDFEGMTEKDAQAHFKELLVDTIRLRMRSDVAQGSCLSGGLDSSAVVCLSQDLNSDLAGYATYTGRFPDSEADEGKWAAIVVEETGVKNVVANPSSGGFLDELPDFMWHNELPMASASQYAQWCVFRSAKDHGTTVLLDGQGADELLGGYEQYFGNYLESLDQTGDGARKNEELPLIKERYPLALLTGDQQMKQNLPHWARHLAARFSGGGSDFSFGLTSPMARRLHLTMPSSPPNAGRFHPLTAALYEDSLYTHLPVLLRYGDRNSMAHSREVRLPFCDHRLAEFVLSLRAELLMGGAETKRLLRGALKGVLPEQIRTRWNKQGFLPPAADWFRQNLLAHVRGVIEDPGFRQAGIWQIVWWRAVLRRFENGEDHLASMLWRPLIEDAWRRHFVTRAERQKKFTIFADAR